MQLICILLLDNMKEKLQSEHHKEKGQASILTKLEHLSPYPVILYNSPIPYLDVLVIL